MALPPENNEQSLEEYLDDALHGDERQAVEDALASDSALTQRLENLQAERELRLQAMVGDSRFRNIRLDAGFAGRVLAAIEQAEGAPVTGPLEPSAQVAAQNTAKGRNWRPVVIAMAALAACLMVAYFGLVPADDSEGAGPEVAGSNPVTPAVPAEDMVPGADLASVPAAERAAPELAQADPSLAIAASDSKQGMPLNDQVLRRDRVPPPADAIKVPTPEMVAIDRPVAELSPSLQMPQGDLKMVLVYEVSRTELGKSNGAVLAALQKAGIGVKARQPVAERVVSYLQKAELVSADANPDDAASGSILYVEASGKALDRFMVAMFADSDNIAGLRWNLAFDPPLIAAVKELGKIDFAKVQHEGGASTAWQLTRQGGGAEGFVFPAGPSRLQPLQRESWKAAGSAALGPDIQSQVLLLIR